MGTFSRRLLGISPRETTFARRGFRCDSAAVRERLEQVGRCFLAGYLRGLETPRCDALAVRLEAEVERDFRGFAYEGAAMAYALLDILTPWRRHRLRDLLEGPGDAHVYVVHVGAGWALARLPVRVDPALARLHPVFRWLALDGFGFHQGYFHWPEAVVRQRVPRRVRGYARRAFDQGLGRSLWFVEGADPGRIAAAIAAFPTDRHGDLWSGVGLACCYAGGVDRGAVEELSRAAGDFRPHLGQGAAFAAKARLRAGIVTADSALACAVLCGGATVEAAAAATDEALLAMQAGFRPAAAGLPDFEHWRRAIQQRIAPAPAADVAAAS